MHCGCYTQHMYTDDMRSNKQTVTELKRQLTLECIYQVNVYGNLEPFTRWVHCIFKQIMNSDLNL